LWYHPLVGYTVLGTAKKIWMDRYLPWYLEPVTDFGFGYLAAHQRTRGASLRVATSIGRNVSWAASAAWRSRAGFAARNLAWRGAMAGGAAALAVAGPVAAGYAVSYAIAGKEGTSDFTDFITGGVSPKEYWDTITLKDLRS
jgi:subtilisin family serine protease